MASAYGYDQGNDQHKWFICIDLKMVNFLLGQ